MLIGLIFLVNLISADYRREAQKKWVEGIKTSDTFSIKYTDAMTTSRLYK